MLELLLLIRVLNEALSIKKLALRYDIELLSEAVAAFNWASVANVASKLELNCSKFVTLVLTEALSL